MKSSITKVVLIALVLVHTISVFASCDTLLDKLNVPGLDSDSDSTTGSNSETDDEIETDIKDEIENFNYLGADMDEYFTLPSYSYLDNSVTLGTEYVVTDKMVDEYIDSLRFENKTKTNGDTQVTDQAIKLGDSAFIYYTGYLNGTAFNGGSNASDAKPHELSIGSGSFIPGFEEGLIGIIPSETSKENPFELHVTFPENYQSADLAGKAVIFEVWVVYTVQYTIPELNNDFVKNTIKYDGTVDQYKAYVNSAMIEEARAAAEEEALNKVVEKLLKDSTVKEYPEQAIAYCIENYKAQIQQYVDYYAMYGYQVTFEEMALQLLGLNQGDDWEGALRKMAEEDVKATLLYFAIAQDNGITATDADVQAKAKELAEYYSSDTKTYTPEEIIKEMGFDNIKQGIIFDGVAKLITENCTIEYKD